MQPRQRLDQVLTNAEIPEMSLETLRGGLHVVLTLQEVVQLSDVMFVVFWVTAVESNFNCMRTNHQTCNKIKIITEILKNDHK